MSRKKKWTLRSALFEIEALIPKADRSPEAERERDLLSVAACALWDDNIKKFTRAVRRLQGTTRREEYSQVMALV